MHIPFNFNHQPTCSPNIGVGLAIEKSISDNHWFSLTLQTISCPPPPSAALALLKCLDVLQIFALSGAKLPCVSHIISFKLPLTIISMHARNHVQLESNATKAVCRKACNNMSVNARLQCILVLKSSSALLKP